MEWSSIINGVSIGIAILTAVLTFIKVSVWCSDAKLKPAKDTQRSPRCPRCGQCSGLNATVNFCSKCGFMLTTRVRVKNWMVAQGEMLEQQRKLAADEKPKVIASLAGYPNVKIETMVDRTLVGGDKTIAVDNFWLAEDSIETFSPSAGQTAKLNGIPFPISYYRNGGSNHNTPQS